MRVLTLVLFFISSTLCAQPLNNEIRDLIIKAGNASNVDPIQLTTIAALESTFKAKAQSKYSSARGLFQFTKRTWRVTVESYKSNYQVGIWDINDPYHNTLMGAEYLKENKRILEKRLNREVTLLDSYLAHLLAPRRVVYLDKVNQQKNIVKLYPKLAKYNKALFYTKQGQPRTVSEFKQFINKKINRAYNVFGKVVEEELVFRKEQKNKELQNIILTSVSKWWVCNSSSLVRELKGNIKKSISTIDLISLKSPVLISNMSLSNIPNTPTPNEIKYINPFYDRRLLG